MIKSWPASFIFIGLRIREIEKILAAIRNCGRWSDIEAVKLPEVVLGIAILEKMLSINNLELLFTLVGCSI